MGNTEGGTGRAYDETWGDAARAVAEAGLRGLSLSCPRCGGGGILFSKWVPKMAVKPLYVCHSNGNGAFKACHLTREQSQAARSQIGLRRDDVLKTLRMGKAFVLFSGGKDSLCLLEYLRRLAKELRKEITALHVDTTAGFPEVEEYVARVCRRLKVPLDVLRPTHDYFEIAKRWGIPGVRARWCCETLKVAPIRRYLAQVEGPKVVFDGIRAAESPTSATYVPVWYHPAFRCLSVSPIFYWSDARVRGYIEKHGLPKSPVAHLNTSAECWCGAYKCRRDFEGLLEVHPEIFEKLVEVEEAQNGRFTFLFEGGQRVPLKSLKT